MATIVKRGEKWRVLVRRAGFPTRTGTFETKGAAQRWARQVELDMDHGRVAGGVVTGTVGDLLDRYARELHVLGRAPSRNKQSVLDILNAGLGEVPVRRLSADRIIDYAKKRHAAGAGPVTINIDLSYLGGVLRMAKAVWRLDVSDEPVRDARAGLAHLGLTGRSRQRDRRPKPQELRQLFDYWQGNPRMRLPMVDIVNFAIGTAMRLGEIVGLRWADFSPSERLLTIRDRKHPREKRGNDEVVPLLAVRGIDPVSIIDAQPRGNDRIFPFKAESVGAAFERACAKCGIDDLRFHDLRHEGVSRLFEIGLSIERVALVSGHKDWKTLRRYTHLKPQDLLHEVALLSPLQPTK